MTEQHHTSLPYETFRVDDELVLRGLNTADSEELFKLVDANRVYLAQYLPWANSTKSVDDSIAFIQKTKQERLNGSGYGFGLILNGEIAGHVGLMDIQSEKSELGPEIGYWITEAESGKGLTTKAAEALTDFGLNELKLDSIIIRAKEDNVASNRVAEKLGYTYKGVFRDDDNENCNHWVITNKSTIKV